MERYGKTGFRNPGTALQGCRLISQDGNLVKLVQLSLGAKAQDQGSFLAKEKAPPLRRAQFNQRL